MLLDRFDETMVVVDDFSLKWGIAQNSLEEELI